MSNAENAELNGGDELTLDDEDIRILRECWAEIRHEDELRAEFKAAYKGSVTPIDADYDGKSRHAIAWDESKHHRGQPENAGEFGPGGGKAAVQSQQPSPVAPAQSQITSPPPPKPKGTAGAGAWGNRPAPAGGLPSQGRVAGIGFVSPNQGDPMDYAMAARNVRSPQMQAWVNRLEEIAAGCGLRARVSPAVGDWAPAGEQPGAEQSAEIEFDGVQDYDQLKYAMAIMGKQSRQLSVLSFVDDHGGPDTIWEIETSSGPEYIRAALDKYNLPYRTVIDLGQGRSRVVLFDQGTQLEANAEALASEYGTHLFQRTGHGEFFPTGAASREDAIGQYDAFIAQYEQQHPDRQLWGQQQAAPQAGEQNRTGEGHGIPVRVATPPNAVALLQSRVATVYQQKQGLEAAR